MSGEITSDIKTENDSLIFFISLKIHYLTFTWWVKTTPVNDHLYFRHYIHAAFLPSTFLLIYNHSFLDCDV